MNKVKILAIILICNLIACGQSNNAQTVVTPISVIPKVSLGVVGDTSDVNVPTRSGIVLMGGGTDVDEAIKWMINQASGGDFVIIRSSGSTGYNQYIYDFGKVNSVETLLINSTILANDAYVERKLRQAEMVFIAGGDQATYVNYWKDTKTEDALNYLINTKKVPVGGTSAGCAILGEGVFDALINTITTQEALANPYDSKLTLQKTDFLNVPFLKNTITDTHYSERDRQGRHFTFLARAVKDWAWNGKGIGVDEKTAVCIDENGIGIVYGSGSAYFLMSNVDVPEICEKGEPLTWNRSKTAVKSYIIAGNSKGNGSFDLKDWKNAKEQGGVWEKFFAEKGVFKREK